MDGNRLTYVGGGKQQIIDYDNLNSVALQASSPEFTPFFSADYRYIFSLTGVDEGLRLNSTALRIK